MMERMWNSGNRTPERFNDVSNAGFLSLGPTDMVGRTDPLP